MNPSAHAWCVAPSASGPILATSVYPARARTRAMISDVASRLPRGRRGRGHAMRRREAHGRPRRQARLRPERRVYSRNKLLRRPSLVSSDISSMSAHVPGQAVTRSGVDERGAGTHCCKDTSSISHVPVQAVTPDRVSEREARTHYCCRIFTV